MVREHLNALKNKGNFTCAKISKLSGIPEATVRKILSGETADPRFETIVKLVTAMGGSMDDLVGGKKVVEIEGNAVITIKDVYESRIDELKDHLASVKRDKKVLTWVTISLVVVIVLLFGLDISLGSAGWI